MANGCNRDNEEQKEESPSQPNRDRIYQYITNNPGCHLRKIGKDLDLAMGHTQYHLKTLQKADLINLGELESSEDIIQSLFMEKGLSLYWLY